MLKKLKLSAIAQAVDGTLIGDDCDIIDVSTDSREALEQKLFVALVGERFDGHDFAEAVMQQGAAALLVSQSVAFEPRIEVVDTTLAYGAIGRLQREAFTHPVVAITGSNGKTSVKDWLASALEQEACVLKTHSNLNNQIGVPKTLLGLSDQYDYAVVEAGTSFPGEIEKLGHCLAADVVVLTNASGSHLSGFGSIQGIAEEKGKLIETARDNATVVLNADDASFEYWCGLLEQRNLLSFAFDNPATLWVRDMQVSEQGTQATLVYAGEEFSLSLDRPGKHHVANAMAVALALLALGFSMAQALSRLRHPAQVPGRMELVDAKNEALIINDCYNASPKSVEAAIDVLALYKDRSKWLVLGALGELGDQEDVIHQDLGSYAAQQKIDHIITIGELAGLAAKAFESVADQTQTTHACASKTEALALLEKLDSNHVILVKGSRSAKMEDIVNALKI
ncbi:UDP-N-acetylmuramoyl-tripeptide--D-alanyl-D-alanine ligase [Marinomonas ostreistagni]|nr:UDP-N-acetylmuramoyl-tripeptide--D-alanyl-D-alanine ligase [Marinomonas ostreistagni]MBM6549746.1 UDP-N-acetylmuramoyl-tripeptide--D-alanyl-D-alanine ligase [Marinomonas ostreistagni]